MGSRYSVVAGQDANGNMTAATYFEGKSSSYSEAVELLLASMFLARHVVAIAQRDLAHCDVLAQVLNDYGAADVVRGELAGNHAVPARPMGKLVATERRLKLTVVESSLNYGDMSTAALINAIQAVCDCISQRFAGDTKHQMVWIMTVRILSGSVLDEQFNQVTCDEFCAVGIDAAYKSLKENRVLRAILASQIVACCAAPDLIDDPEALERIAKAAISVDLE